jgi:uncharacterized membrane protein YkoI
MTKNRIQKRHMGVFVAIMAIAIVGAISIGSSYAASSSSCLASAKITPGDATTIAINHLGTQLSNLNEVDMDKENGTCIYSVDFIIGDQDVSVEIDPQTGEILVVEQEPVGAPDTDDDGDEDNEDDND